jgi:hypothetical protein
MFTISAQPRLHNAVIISSAIPCNTEAHADGQYLQPKPMFSPHYTTVLAMIACHVVKQEHACCMLQK